MQVLGKTIEINKDNPNWVNEISDLISDSRQREAVTDLSVIAQALVSEVAMHQARADKAEKEASDYSWGLYPDRMGK